jgi:hypothetical protein
LGEKPYLRPGTAGSTTSGIRDRTYAALLRPARSALSRNATCSEGRTWNLSQIFIGSKIIQIFRELFEQDRREAERASATNIVRRAERGLKPTAIWGMSVEIGPIDRDCRTRLIPASCIRDIYLSLGSVEYVFPRDMRKSIPKFLNGVFSFVGGGYEKSSLLSGNLTYSVPPDKRTHKLCAENASAY